MTKARTAMIIGGGIAGSVAAMALHQAGIRATVYESYGSTADGVGGMLGLAPNGLGALGVIGLDDAIHRVAIPVPSMIIQSWTGKRLARFGTESGPPILHVVWRAELHRMLADEGARRGIAIEYGRRLVGATSGADGVTATFADGSRATADVLVGADGIRSTVRTLIDPGAPAPGYTGLLGFGGWASGGLPSTSDGSMHMGYGKRAFFSYAAVEDRTGWFVNLPARQPMTLTEANAVGADTWLRELAGVFAGDRLPAQEILRRTAPEDLPLLLLSGVLLPMSLAPGWLDVLSHLDPLRYVVDGMRATFLGHYDLLGRGLIAAFALAAAGVAIGTYTFIRETR